MKPDTLLLIFTVATAVIKTCALDVSVKGDECAIFDRCTIRNIFSTCSCDADCHMYGLCCINADTFPFMSTTKKEYVCKFEQITTPVFSKISCSEDFKGHVAIIDACSDQQGRDPADMKGSLLVTSSRTKITYINKDCAICSNEKEEDLHFWTVEVSCPARVGEFPFSEKYIRKHLIFNENLGKWGMKTDSSFVVCSVLVFEPDKVLGDLKYCAPNLISQCPRNYTDNAVSKMCGYYYGERKEKNSNVYYKNAHCALCNGVSLKDLDCVGRTYAPVESDETLETVKVVFTDGVGLERKDKFKCSENFSYDVFQDRCRRSPTKRPEVKVENSAALLFVHQTLLIALTLIHFLSLTK
ncbi:uncharacterized protein LOC129227363 [Uloborus diversus]|uniref:uncharacterized protein LOC129227363 n=1 Tax=Uloborus diversus TaxID=327109 RepID=UPI00240A8922|nr:uncharacterized protein LOC129227363 [Uloborus diversus]